MGVIGDFRSGERGGSGGAIVFWPIVGLALVFIVSYGTDGFDKFGWIFAVMGAAVGLGIGFYAEFSKSTLAKILALPGFLVLVITSHG